MTPATFYVQLILRSGGWASPVAVTMGRPEIARRRGVLVVKVTLRIPDEAFDPLVPEVEIDVPLEHTSVVEAQTLPFEETLPESES
jgi:hypothetical protein